MPHVEQVEVRLSHVNPSALLLDIYSLVHHLYKM